QAITFTNDVMEIQLQDNANGSVQISIEASDGTFDVTDQFTLEIQPVQDDPVAAPDSYFVPLGSNFQITSVNNGLLANDFDPDGDSIQIDLASVTQASRGSRVVNADGTFEYSNQSGSVGDTDQFTYRVTDGVNFSEFVTVSFVLTPSEYQNPTQRADVNADGQVSAIDALLVINFLNRNLDDVELEDNPANSVPVGLIGTPPPNYLDVNGDGRVSALDALNVINELRSNNNQNGEGEALLALSATTGYASMASQGLPVRNLQRVEGSADASRDEIFAGSIEVNSQLNQGDDDWFFGEDAESSADGDTLDEALSGFLNDGDLPSNL
ncbi:MAG: dockerin type I domain-containing protein, partial [Planctomycetota bacterium]|nr:dockerin type I domain-containing protein [Planctomycetota bacterium]